MFKHNSLLPPSFLRMKLKLFCRSSVSALAFLAMQSLSSSPAQSAEQEGADLQSLLKSIGVSSAEQQAQPTLLNNGADGTTGTETDTETTPSEVELIAPALEALWRKGGATDFSPEAWAERTGLSLDRWDGIAGSNVSDLTQSAAFYSTPSAHSRLNTARVSAQEAADFANDSNGLRLRGLLVIPADGEYTFAIASDDSSELWLGELGGSRFSKKRALNATSYVAEDNWTKHITTPRHYKAGDIIWLEALSKNLGGIQHLSVAWKKPGDADFSAIPEKLANGRVVLSVPPLDPEDPNDIGVPEEWLNSVGLGGINPQLSPEARLYGDTDGDGYTLLEEYQTGGRPDAWGGNMGGFEIEKFANPSTIDLKLYKSSADFLTRTSGPTSYKGELSLKGGSSGVVQRIRARLVPPMSGNWTFYESADAQAILYLSTDGSRFQKKELASHTSYTDIQQWTKFPTQKSAPLRLEAGQEYFLEILHQQKNTNAHVEVGWKCDPLNLCREAGIVVTQSSQYADAVPENAIDGDIVTEAHSSDTGTPNWWQVDFSLPRPVGRVVLKNRTDWWNMNRLSNFRIQVLDAQGTEVAGQDFYTEEGTFAGETVTWTLPETVYGQVVKVKQLGQNAQGNYYLCLREVEVYEVNPLCNDIMVIGEEYIETIPQEPNDSDNNSLPDDWQQEKGLVVGKNGLTALDCSEYGDPDGDMVSNRDEYMNGTDPLLSDGAISGALTREFWSGIPGWSVDDSMKDPIVLGNPNFSELNKGAETPRNCGDNYHQRLRGTVTAPVTGDYTFWISSDETSILYLSPNERKFQKKEIARVGYAAGDKGVYLTEYNNWTMYPRQRSETIHLEAGQKYYIEAQHKQYHSIDHLQIAWQMPGGVREVIPAEYLSSFAKDMTDKDDDDLPDEWETQYGISPTDNGSKDFSNGAWGDPYNTGITNREAYLLGWDPRAPSLPDFGDTVVDIPAGGGEPVIGDWVPSGTGILVPMGRGSISYSFEVSSKGRYLLEITATPTGNLVDVETIDLSLIVDGQSLGSMTLRSLHGAPGRVLFLLPELTAGSHNFIVEMKNKDLRRTFTINSLKLLRPDGVSEDGCDLPQWLHDYLNSSNSFTRCPVSSLTSPVCVEGKARALHLTRLTAGGQNKVLNSSAGTGWYANVPLPEDGSSLPVTATFESGAHTLSSSISWESCDILTHGQMTVRQGDSLRLVVGSGENALTTTVTYTKGDQEIVSDANQAVPLLFNQPGVHTVKATWSVPAAPSEDGKTEEQAVPQTATMTVNVVGLELGDPKDLIVGLGRTLPVGVIPQEILLQTAAPLRMDPVAGSNNVTTMKFSAEKGGAWHMIGRLGESGPIVDTLAFISHDSTSSSTLSRIEVVEGFGDGTSLVCVYLASDSLPPGGYIKMNILASGVQFIGGGTEKKFYAEDFGPDGLLRVMMTTPTSTITSICHATRFYNAQGQEL